jgi:PPM family protein phosphatase
VGAAALSDGDVFLLCSDGWWEALDDSEIQAGLRSATSLSQWLDAMAEAVNRRARPDQDNYSALGCWIGEPSESTLMPAGPPSAAGAQEPVT